jgi:hypothetical protein
MKYLRFKLQQARNVLSDPRYVPFFVQRRFTRPATRERIATWLAERRPARADTAAGNPDKRRLLAENGIAHLGQLLTADQVADVRAYLEQKLVSDAYQPQFDAFEPLSPARPHSTHIAFHEPVDVVAAPHLLALANRPELLAIAEDFLGCRPTIGYLASWWSYATDEPALAAEKFHRDVDDWRFLKLFVYLSDVGETQGPHIYVQASAGSERLLEIRRFEDAEVAATFGNNAILVNTGRAGEGFVENTYGIHKGQPVEQGYRVLFQTVYTMSELPYAPRRPVGDLAQARAHTGMALDPYVNRLYLKDGAAR